MFYSAPLNKLVAAACILHLAVAHPGQTIEELRGEIVGRQIFFEDTNTPRDLRHCADILRKRGAEDFHRERLARAVAKAREDLGLPQSKFFNIHQYPEYTLTRHTEKAAIKARATSPLSISHLSGLDVTPTTANVEEIIYSNSSCVLSLEGETGPFCK